MTGERKSACSVYYAKDSSELFRLLDLAILRQSPRVRLVRKISRRLLS